VLVVLVMPVTVVPPEVNAQVAVLLMSLPDGDAIAVRQNGMPPLADTLCDDGVTVIDETGVEIVMVAEPLTVTLVAVIVACPVHTPVTTPAAETDAIV